MKPDSPGIAFGGEGRLREAIEAEVKRAHQDELSAATESWQKMAVKEKIKREVEEWLKRVASAHSLWSSH